MKTVMISPRGFGSNCWLLIDEINGDAVIIDPSPKISLISEMLIERKAVLRAVLLTHGHFDHMTSSDDIRKLYNVPLYIHKADEACMTDGLRNAYSEFFGGDLFYNPADIFLHDGDTITFGKESLTVMHTPGHTPGSVCYIAADAVYSGDTLFDMSVGRADLSGGNEAQLQNSLKRIVSLDDSLILYPGHGSVSTIGKQKQFNPYLKGLF